MDLQLIKELVADKLQTTVDNVDYRVKRLTVGLMPYLSTKLPTQGLAYIIRFSSFNGQCESFFSGDKVYSVSVENNGSVVYSDTNTKFGSYDGNLNVVGAIFGQKTTIAENIGLATDIICVNSSADVYYMDFYKKR